MAFKSEEFAWSDIKMVVAGRPTLGVTGVEYTVRRTTNHIYAAGNKPHSRTKGNKEYTGRIRMLQSELEALTDAAKSTGGEDATDITFDVVVNYSKTVLSRMVTDVLVAVDITEIPKGMNQNDPNMTVELPIMIGEIKHGLN